MPESTRPKKATKRTRAPRSYASNPDRQMPADRGKFGRHRQWSLRIVTFGRPPRFPAYGVKSRGGCSPASDLHAQQLANAGRGAAIAAYDSATAGDLDDVAFSLIRLQSLLAEAIRRVGADQTGEFTVVHDEGQWPDHIQR